MVRISSPLDSSTNSGSVLCFFSSFVHDQIWNKDARMRAILYYFLLKMDPLCVSSARYNIFHVPHGLLLHGMFSGEFGPWENSCTCHWDCLDSRKTAQKLVGVGGMVVHVHSICVITRLFFPSNLCCSSMLTLLCAHVSISVYPSTCVKTS